VVDSKTFNPDQSSKDIKFTSKQFKEEIFKQTKTALDLCKEEKGINFYTNENGTSYTNLEPQAKIFKPTTKNLSSQAFTTVITAKNRSNTTLNQYMHNSNGFDRCPTKKSDGNRSIEQSQQTSKAKLCNSFNYGSKPQSKN
jgi:hypothetical protein